MRNYILLLALFSAGCGQHMAALPTIKPYKMEIQQGNVVTPKMMMQLRPGMNKSQVRFIMGTPLLVDSFHADRWDYFYEMRKQGKLIERRRVTLEFEDDGLKRVRGDVIPAGSDPNVMTVEPVSEPTSSTAPSKRDEKGWLDKLKFWESDDKAKTKPVPEQKPAAEPKAEQKAEPAVAPAVVPAQEDAAPVSKLPEIAPQPIPETLPPLTEEAPAAAPAPAKEAVPVTKPVEKVAPAKPVETPKPAAPIAVPKETAPVEKQEVKQAAPAKEEAKPATKTDAAKPSRPLSKTPPAPPKDLPPEDAPDFFEKMLEKIGF